MSYDIRTHRPKFAIWAASRAVQRGWKQAKVSCLRESIEKCGVGEFIRDTNSIFTSSETFELLHRQWCDLIQACLAARGVEASYGRAAKLLAVYLKTMIVIAGLEKTPLAYAIHPPIDRQLLQTVAGAKDIPHLRYVSWTQLEKDQYYALVHVLRQLLQEGQPFWMLEEYWPITDD
jgi:hypothetical protein